jgi:hypothetical protein
LDWLERGGDRGYLNSAVFENWFRDIRGEPRFVEIREKAKNKLKQFDSLSEGLIR